MKRYLVIMSYHDILYYSMPLAQATAAVSLEGGPGPRALDVVPASVTLVTFPASQNRPKIAFEHFAQ